LGLKKDASASSFTNPSQMAMPSVSRRKNQPSETRHLIRALAAASDIALMNVVGILDRLSTRHEADRLLDAARPRLRQPRPARSLQFTRLLFLPLDGAIADNAEWRRDDWRLPCAGLPCIAEALRSAKGQEARHIDAILEAKPSRVLARWTELAATFGRRPLP